MKARQILVTLAALLLPAVAGADIRGEIRELGMSVSAGAGLMQFAEAGMREFATEGMSWESRIGLGTKTPFTVEATYLHGPVDLRAVYRATAAVDMFAGASEGSLASWSSTLGAGFEY
jgi:hypothetical protein